MTWTELHEACEHQDGCKITRIAHQHCKEALETDDHGWIPLHVLCCGNPDLNAVKALVTACPQSLAGQDVKGDTVCFPFCIIDDLYDSSLNSLNHSQPLHVACSFPRTDTHLVELLVDVFPAALSMTNHEGLMPLHVACRHDPHNFELIKLLVKRYPCALEKGIKVRLVRICFILFQDADPCFRLARLVRTRRAIRADRQLNFTADHTIVCHSILRLV